MAYLVRRLAYSVLTVFGVASILFFLLHLTGNPAVLYLPPRASFAAIARYAHVHGFDQPLAVQYVRFIGQAVTGNFGDSLTYGQSAASLVLQFLPRTAELALTATVMAILIGVPTGIFAALKRGTFVDALLMTTTLAGLSAPGFWLGLMLILIFGVRLGILPVAGSGGISHLILPGFTIAVTVMAGDLARILRANIVEALGQDYVRTARAMGLRPTSIILRHVLRNALLPTLTVFALDFAAVITGVYVIEVVFAYPGIGFLTITAITQRDFPVVEASVFLASVAYVGINLIVDILYTVLDPRIRLSGGEAGG